jgi:hypothetical protein
VSGGPVMRREVVDVVVLERESVVFSEKKRRVEDARFGGAKVTTAGESGGDMGPRRSFRRWTALSHKVHGCVWLSPTWPQPLCCVKFWKHIVCEVRVLI